MCKSLFRVVCRSLVVINCAHHLLLLLHFSSQSATESSSIDTSLYDSICADRISFASSVAESPVNKHRIRLMTKSAKKIDPEATGGIAYWMLRDQRVQDNWALLYAQQLALQRGVPLHVVVGFIPNKFHLINLRTAAFQIKGLQVSEHQYIVYSFCLNYNNVVSL